MSLLIQVRKLAPKHMQNDEAGHAARHAHVTCANFSRQGEIVATYNDEVHIVQSCTSTCVCSPTASDIIPRQRASSLAERNFCLDLTTRHMCTNLLHECLIHLVNSPPVHVQVFVVSPFIHLRRTGESDPKIYLLKFIICGQFCGELSPQPQCACCRRCIAHLHDRLPKL